MARCKRRLDQSEEARALLDELLSIAPEDGETLWERGQLELDQGRASEAECWLRKAVMERPHDAALRCEKGLLFLRKGEAKGFAGCG